MEDGYLGDAQCRVQCADLLENVDGKPASSGPTAAENHQCQALYYVQNPKQRSPVQGKSRTTAWDLLEEKRSLILLLLMAHISPFLSRPLPKIYCIYKDFSK